MTAFGGCEKYYITVCERLLSFDQINMVREMLLRDKLLFTLASKVSFLFEAGYIMDITLIFFLLLC